jgi:hypothetical protein
MPAGQAIMSDINSELNLVQKAGVSPRCERVESEDALSDAAQ